jgi:two-component sensor histidine kinase
MHGVRTLDWALILAPYRKDADYLQALLEEHEVRAEQAAASEDLEARLATFPGIIIATHEALNPAVIDAVANHLSAQANWSEMPIIILLDRAVPQARIRSELSAAWPRSRQLFYQRPVAAWELLSGIQSMLLARLRQRDVRDHIEREVELRHELNHRVKNILASVMSIFAMTRRGAISVGQLADDFIGRMVALANVHSAVFQSGGEAVELSEVADITFMPYRSAGEDRIVATGPAVTISRAAATSLALCLHELATNAIKYGSLSRPGGRVHFAWKLSSPQDGLILSVQWTESGGPPVSQPIRVGYGTNYVRAALSSLFGVAPQILFDQKGLQCIASGPLSKVSFNPEAAWSLHGPVAALPPFTNTTTRRGPVSKL